MPLFTTVDDETYAELNELAGQHVVHVAVWEDALDEALAEMGAMTGAATEGETTGEPADQTSFDLDVYLEEGAYFELYGVTCFPALDGEPWTGHAQVDQRLKALVGRRATLQEVAVDEEDNLVLILGKGKEQVFLLVGAWLLEEWDEFPEA
jgi:hypothetical protein